MPYIVKTDLTAIEEANCLHCNCLFQIHEMTIWISGYLYLHDIDYITNSISCDQYRKTINEQYLLIEPEFGLPQVVPGKPPLMCSLQTAHNS
ncbi:hypothetical protein MAR_019393 [Mya arenaria]|uniref:Uncharacterized protein n=1 Tax=Mya arenaria TaxID=6604 RepID=A0ABY7EHS6_MYAAR|nr:hypothetical protein MAR_019393 [Mya arenaria]